MAIELDMSPSRRSRYTLKKRIARGGMAEVYLALKQPFDQRVVVKLLSEKYRSSEKGEALLIQEGKFLSQFNHPNILRFIDMIENAQGHMALVTEYIDGVTLHQQLYYEHLLSVRASVQIALGVTRALHELHLRQLVHRDIKPENIMVSGRFKDSLHATLVDFGTVKSICPQLKELTQKPSILATPQYMAPERISQGMEIDPRSDLYALGCCMYEMLQGAPPFVSDDVKELLGLHVMGTPKPLPGWVPSELNTIVLTLLEKAPSNRFDSAQSLHEALKAFEYRYNYSQCPAQPQRKSKYIAISWSRDDEVDALLNNLADVTTEVQDPGF